MTDPLAACQQALEAWQAALDVFRRDRTPENFAAEVEAWEAYGVAWRRAYLTVHYVT